MVTYKLVENPIRHLGASPKKSVVMGLGAVIVTVAAPVAGDLGRILAVAQLHDHAGVERTNPLSPGGRGVVDNKSAKDLQPVPVGGNWGGGYENASCQASASQSTESICILGDTTARRLMVVYGDSHALMWLPAFDNIARTAHLRLVILAKPACPAELVTVAISQPMAQRTAQSCL